MRRSHYGIAIFVVASVATSGCVSFRAPLREHVLKGSQFIHYLRFPEGFRPSFSDADQRFDHLNLRIRPSNPGMLVVAACSLVTLDQVCSENAYLVDTAHNYAVTPAQIGEWEWSWPAPGSGAQLSNEASPSGIPVAGNEPGNGAAIGYSLRGKDYFRRNESTIALTMSPSSDGRLVVLIGENEQKLPANGFLSTNRSFGLYGNFTLDIFERDPNRKLGEIDVDCGMEANHCRYYIGEVNSRWFTVGLSKDLRQAMLFDAGPSGSSDGK